MRIHANGLKLEPRAEFLHIWPHIHFPAQASSQGGGGGKLDFRIMQIPGACAILIISLDILLLVALHSTPVSRSLCGQNFEIA